MPIIGLTDRTVSFHEIGRIRKGAPKPKNGNRPGEDLTYFRFDFDEIEAEALSILESHYGTDQIREVDVLLPFDQLEGQWDAWVEAYLAGGLVHRSDGMRVHYHMDPGTGERTVFNCEPHTLCPSAAGDPVAWYINAKGKNTPVYASPIGRLKVILPVLRRLVYMTLVTTSQYDIGNISQNLGALLQIHGRLAGIPLVMKRKPISIRRKLPDGSMMRKDSWLIFIEPSPQWVDKKFLVLHQESLPKEVVGYLPETSGTEDQSDWIEEPEQNQVGSQPVASTVDQSTGEILDAELVQESETELVSDPEPKPALTGRPYTLPQLKTRLAAKIKHHAPSGYRRDMKYKGKIKLWEFTVWMIQIIFEEEFKDDSDLPVNFILEQIVGNDRTTVTGAECMAILDWLSPEITPTGDYRIDPMSEREALAIFKARESKI